MPSPRTRLHRLRLLPAAAASVVLAFTGGCSDSSGSSEAAVPGDDVALGSLLAEGAEVEDPRGAISWLDDFTCAADPDGRWTARGKVVNPDQEPATVLLRVAVVVRDTGRVLGRKVEEMLLEPGEEREFTYRKFRRSSTGKVKHHACVPRVVRGAA